MPSVSHSRYRRSTSSRPAQRDLEIRRMIAAAELMTAVPFLTMPKNAPTDNAVNTIHEEIQSLLDALPPSEPVLESDSADALFAENLLGEDGFTLTQDQFKAGLRLAVSEDGLIARRPSCGRRRLLTFCDTEPSGKRFAEKIRTVCAEGLGLNPTCGYYELV